MAPDDPDQNAPPNQDRDGIDRMLTPGLQARVVDKVTDLAATTVRDHVHGAPPGAVGRAREAALAFFDLYDQRPVKDNKGGSGFNDSLWLFCAARALAPDLIVESGVFRGHSTWLLRQACPEAEIHSFDPDLTNLVHRDPRGGLYDVDWTDKPLPSSQGRRALIFFDDHVNQARRVREAQERGFRDLLFDDNFPAEHLYAVGVPPIPTLEMVMDPAIADHREIRWRRRGKSHHEVLDIGEISDCKRLIKHYFVFPDLAPLTRYSAGSGLTLVKLVD